MIRHKTPRADVKVHCYDTSDGLRGVLSGLERVLSHKSQHNAQASPFVLGIVLEKLCFGTRG